MLFRRRRKQESANEEAGSKEDKHSSKANASLKSGFTAADSSNDDSSLSSSFNDHDHDRLRLDTKNVRSTKRQHVVDSTDTALPSRNSPTRPSRRRASMLGSSPPELDHLDSDLAIPSQRSAPSKRTSPRVENGDRLMQSTQEQAPKPQSKRSSRPRRASMCGSVQEDYQAGPIKSSDNTNIGKPSSSPRTARRRRASLLGSTGVDSDYRTGAVQSSPTRTSRRRRASLTPLTSDCQASVGKPLDKANIGKPSSYSSSSKPSSYSSPRSGRRPTKVAFKEATEANKHVSTTNSQSSKTYSTGRQVEKRRGASTSEDDTRKEKSASKATAKTKDIENVKEKAASRPTENKSFPGGIHGLVNSERTKRGLKPFSRNMLLDTMAKELANEMARSDGRLRTRPVYHGNVANGDSVREIHETLMNDRKGPARHNILNPHFLELGMAISRAKDGSLYMCQLFKS